MLIVHNERLLDFVRSSYSASHLDKLKSFLDRQTTFDFPLLPTGLFSAARLSGDNQYTGYNNVWVRDNIHIAYAHLVSGKIDIAVRCLQALCLYFQRHSSRFSAIIRGDADPNDPMNRPHIRFDGTTLQENPEKWSHAQNDALGGFCWLFCRLARDGHIQVEQEQWNLLGLFALYFQAINYCRDEDSGHWEEARKIEASSIGAVVAGMREMRTLMHARSVEAINGAGQTVMPRTLDALISEGLETLSAILPYECAQANPAKRRRYDAALLFLIFPLRVADAAQAAQILSDVESHLQGDYGVRRYLGDSFWCADYKTRVNPEARTSDVSDDMSARNALLLPGQEAQWCLFDPVISSIYGGLYQDTGSKAHLEKQTHYFNRSLGQLTGADSGFPECLCPELYYLEQGRRVPNDVTPLLWTQANLSIALERMRQSARRP